MDSNSIYSKVIEHFRQLIELNDSDIEIIIAKLEIVKVRKKEFLLEEGEVSKHMRLVVKGSAYAYNLDDKGNERVNQLCIEDWWINDLYSYFKNVPSKLYIQANEESIIVRIQKEDLEYLFKKVPALSDFWRIRIQNAYVALQDHILESNHTDAYSKYKYYTDKFPYIEQRFPQYIIASFLGMTVEYLSSLRKKNL